jgi:hypothetical protein
MRRRALAFSLSLVAFAACGGNNMGNEPTPDAPVAGPPDAMPFQAAQHGAAPQLIEPTGGLVLTAPKIVPIFFGTDVLQTDTETFLGDIPGSDFWTKTTQEYGVGNLTVLPSIVTTDAAPTSDQAIGTYIAMMADGTHTGWPANDQTTIYTVFLPDGDVLSDFPGECSTWLGYHSAAMDAAGNPVVYSVIPHCSEGTGDFLYWRTVALGHETDEAATDPVPGTGFSAMDPDHRVWGSTPGAEDGDLCEYVGNAHQRLLGGGVYAVQRAWSNASAAAGHDPCVPVMKDPYKAATPVLPDDIAVMTRNGNTTTKGVSIPVGTSKTVEVDLWSDGPTDAFTVNAYDVASQFKGQAAQLTFQWDKTMGKNGDKLMLTITHVKAGSTRSGGSEVMITVGTITANTSIWWGLVGN